MPSTTSSSLSSPWPSSTVMTPSLPTFSIASAMVLPMDSSEFAEIVPTCAMALESLQGFERRFNSSVVTSTALSMPRLMSMGLRPEATAFRPSRMIAWTSTVAVVVPSPASSEVLEATSFSICAPIFSNLSSSSISLATVTPSLVTVGAPKLFSSTTLRPLGPRVTVTASARTLTPLRIFSRASCENLTNFAAMLINLLDYGAHFADDILNAAESLTFEHPKNIVLTKNQMLFAFEFDLTAGVLAEQNTIASLHVRGEQLAVFGHFAFADRHHPPLLGLFFGGVRNDDSSLGLFFLLNALDEDSVS